jgi:hypothetical protein
VEVPGLVQASMVAVVTRGVVVPVGLKMKDDVPPFLDHDDHENSLFRPYLGIYFSVSVRALELEWGLV